MVFKKKINKYIIYFKYILNMDGSGQVWRVCNFITQIQSNLLYIYIYIYKTQPNPPSPKNQVGSSLADRWVFCTPYLYVISTTKLESPRVLFPR